MEHLHHFGLSHDPFSNEPDLRFYFESASHLDAQRRVERGLRQQKGLTLLTGEGGMGKTLLTRRILDALEEEVFEATLLVMLAGAADAGGILQRFARQLGCEEPAEDRAGLLGQIYELLAIVREDGRHAVLMMDDAQILTPEVFAEMAGLLNLEYEDRRLLSILFVGSLELDGVVEQNPSLMPRVDVRVRLQPLDLANTTAYLQHRLQTVDGSLEILPPEAIESLCKFGRGRPRLLNTLADNALYEAFLASRDRIEPSDIERAASDLGIGPDPGTTYGPLAGMPSASVAPPPPVTAPGTFGLDLAASSVPDLDAELDLEPPDEVVAQQTPAQLATPAEPELSEEAPAAAEPIALTEPALELVDPVSEFEFVDEPAEADPQAAPAEASAEVVASGPTRAAEPPSSSLDLEESFGDALGEFADDVLDEDAGDETTADGEGPAHDILEFDVDLDDAADFASATPETGSPEVDANPNGAAASPNDVTRPAAPPADPPAVEAVEEAPLEFALAEAELTPLESGDADELDDAFIELLDE